jgi:hypothetical protein
MAKCFTTWTVLPHDPIEKHSKNLWSVSGNMPGGNQRRMSVAKRADDTLVIHNPIALDDAEMQELEAFGKPAYLVVPNAFHRMDSVIYKQRYPTIQVLCPQGARKKVSELVEVAGHLDELPKDSAVELFHLRGLNQKEGALRVRDNGHTSLVFNDALLNIPARGGVAGFFMAPTGVLSVPRFMRWVMMKSGAELKAHLTELCASPGLSHVIPGHGPVVETDVASNLNSALARL